MIILGIETSCDETAVAIVDENRTILSNVVLSQIKDHKQYGGVVPEVAARAHIYHLNNLVSQALDEANLTINDIDGFAATSGPGLIGGVLVGMVSAKAMASALGKPFLAVNHLEGHALTARLTDSLPFPYLLLLISGGHTQILIVEDVGKYKRLGTTLDDACGECFDKSAKMMGLPYPGGPHLEKLAGECADPVAALKKFPLPKPLARREGCDFSFSGLKTAVRNAIYTSADNDQNILTKSDAADIAYSLQETIADVLEDRLNNAITSFIQTYPQFSSKENSVPLVIAGGVAANKSIRSRLNNLSETKNVKLYCPPMKLCTDNAAMIAWTGLERLQRGQNDPLDFKAKPRWPLDPSAPKRHGAGIKA